MKADSENEPQKQGLAKRLRFKLGSFAVKDNEIEPKLIASETLPVLRYGKDYDKDNLPRFKANILHGPEGKVLTDAINPEGFFDLTIVTEQPTTKEQAGELVHIIIPYAEEYTPETELYALRQKDRQITGVAKTSYGREFSRDMLDFNGRVGRDKLKLSRIARLTADESGVETAEQAREADNQFLRDFTTTQANESLELANIVKAYYDNKNFNDELDVLANDDDF